MLILDELPFRHVEGEGFMRFMRVVCPRWVEIPSRRAVARDCFSLYVKEKAQLKSALEGQRVCLTTDTWTSLQNLNYMCLTAHFVDSDWKLHKRILNFCLVENHKGETLGKAVEMCMLGWGISKVLTVTVDNASSNNLLIDFLRRKTKNRVGTILQHEFLHVRCCAHILNLIVCEDLKEMDDSICKVRNAVRYVRSSPSRMKIFQQCVEKEGIKCKSVVCLDVATRWNSTYMMLDGAEKFQKAFERLEEDDMNFLSTFRKGGSDKGGKDRWKHLGPPDMDDWDRVRVFVKFLKLFYNATLRFSGSLHVTANVFFLELILLQNAISQMCEKGDNSILSNMAAGMKRKFEKYWGNFDNSNMLLYVAVVLDPRYKLKFVKFWVGTCYEANKGKELLKKIKDALTRLHD
ncbi:hypothetical protein L1049_021187 [Liquidambar formosana]|uniref:hAT-like transposase RNase-H fold domain-containing protein n=1 Tax=Liquidambar formosana TaxID=63359 RepID=A0AAP0XAP6_LIQFO